MQDKGEHDKISQSRSSGSMVDATIEDEFESTVGYVERSQRNDWVDEKSREILEE